MRSLKRLVELLPWCSYVCLSETGVHCDHTVHFSVDLRFWLDSPMFLDPDTKACPCTYSQPSFSSSTRNRGGVWMCRLSVISQERLVVKSLLSANRKWCMPRRLAQQRMTLSDLEWPFHGYQYRIARYLCGSRAYRTPSRWHKTINVHRESKKLCHPNHGYNFAVWSICKILSPQQRAINFQQNPY